MTNRLLFLAGFGGLLAAGMITAGAAHADPAPPPPPPVPNFTTDQKCIWIAMRTLSPCNWTMPDIPPGTPGSWGQ